MSDNNIPTFKVTFVGPTNVGKTSIINCIDGIGFGEKDISPTTSMECHSYKTKTEDGLDILINFWDTAGQEQFKSLGPMYYRNSSLCVAVFDVSSEHSFEEVKDYIKLFRDNTEFNTPVIIVGNKRDLVKEVDCFEEEIAWAESHSCLIVFTSAKTNDGIDTLILEVTNQLQTEPEVEQEDCQDAAITIRDTPTNKKSKCC